MRVCCGGGFFLICQSTFFAVRAVVMPFVRCRMYVYEGLLTCKHIGTVNE